MNLQVYRANYISHHVTVLSLQEKDKKNDSETLKRWWEAAKDGNVDVLEELAEDIEDVDTADVRLHCLLTECPRRRGGNFLTRTFTG